MHKIPISKMYSVLVISVAVLVLICSSIYFIMKENQPNKVVSLKPTSDFNFRLNFSTNGLQQIDTYKGTFTKDLILDGTKTINFAIPNNVKNEIYKMMMDINILAFPDTLTADETKCTPSCDYKLTVTINGNTKNIVWKEGLYPDMSGNLPKDNVEFLKIVKYVSDYIYSTKEYKSMPQANGGYD